MPISLPIGKGVIRLEQEPEAIEAFLNGVTIGHLLYIAYASKVRLRDTDIVLFLTKHIHSCSPSRYLDAGVIVGFVHTLLKKKNLHITSEVFKQGFQTGWQDAHACKDAVFTLNDLALLVTYRDGKDSAQNSGYIAGFLDGFTQVDDLKQRQGTLCETFGHNWRSTNRPGKFYCCNCRVTGYCSKCLLTLPKGAIVMRCQIHQGRTHE